MMVARRDYNEHFERVDAGEVALNRSQENAVQYVHRFMEERMEQSRYAHSLKFKAEINGGILWVTTDYEEGDAGTLLHALSYNHFFLKIGRRGKITAFGYPSSFEQFAGRKAFGIHFRKGVR